MANKKRTTTSSEKRDLIKFCAFWGLAIAAILFVVTGVLSFCGVGGLIITIFDILGKVALLIAIALPAYAYVRGRAIGWKVFFWIALVVYVLGCVFGVIHIG